MIFSEIAFVFCESLITNPFSPLVNIPLAPFEEGDVVEGFLGDGLQGVAREECLVPRDDRVGEGRGGARRGSAWIGTAAPPVG